MAFESPAETSFMKSETLPEESFAASGTVFTNIPKVSEKRTSDLPLEMVVI